MTTWNATVTLRTGPIGIDQQADLTQAAGSFGVTHEDGANRTTVTVTVEAGTLAQATEAAYKTVRDAAKAVLGRAELIGAAISTIEDYEASRVAGARLDLVGSKEGAEILECSRQQFEELARKNKNFPAPLAELSRGKVWTRQSIEAFKRGWTRKKTGRPSKTDGRAAG